MENSDKHTELEQENRRLRERLALLEAQLLLRKASRNKLVLVLLRTFTGKSLYSSVTQLVDEVAERRLERETIKKVLYATLRRVTRVGAVMLLVALGPLVLAGLQTYYLKKQNEKLDIQNKRIEQQTYLQEAERRSSLVFLFDNVLNKVDEELRMNPGRRALSPQLVGRIVALTKALKPYRFLEGDSITAEMSSPERGQVLLSLLASKLSKSTYDQIFLLADFSYTTLQHVNLDGAYLRNINLSHAVLESVSLTGADLRNANLEGAQLRGARVLATGGSASPASFDFANFHKAILNNCDFSGSSFDYTNFTRAQLHLVSFRNAFFNQARLVELQADTLDFGGATLLNTNLSLLEKDAGTTTVFHWPDIHLDTATYRQIRQLPLRALPVLDTAQREFRIKRDTFYVGDTSQPIVVEDSVELFRTRQ
ncbi:MAG: pentapeptide repeat-containing protein [Lewinellaceae bacterium]|nr:pentapeptide repeat-containing protein [Lewinellaceae bacterium]